MAKNQAAKAHARTGKVGTTPVRGKKTAYAVGQPLGRTGYTERYLAALRRIGAPLPTDARK